jgi:hypothetical protein
MTWNCQLARVRRLVPCDAQRSRWAAAEQRSHEGTGQRRWRAVRSNVWFSVIVVYHRFLIVRANAPNHWLVALEQFDEQIIRSGDHDVLEGLVLTNRVSKHETA